MSALFANTIMTKTFQDIDDLRRYSQKMGCDFFEKTTSDYQCTRIETYLIAGEYFITSELTSGDPSGRSRRCTIRRGTPQGQIETVGNDQEYDSIQQAQQALMKQLEK